MTSTGEAQYGDGSGSLEHIVDVKLEPANMDDPGKAVTGREELGLCSTLDMPLDIVNIKSDDEETDSSMMPYKISSILKTIEMECKKLSVISRNWKKDGVLHRPKYNENKLKRIEHSCPKENNGRNINCKVKRSNLATFSLAEQELDMTYQHDNNSPETLAEPVEAVERQENELDAEQNLENEQVQIQVPDACTNVNAQQNITGVQSENASLSLTILAKMEALEQNYKTLNEKITENIKAQHDDRKLIRESVQSILLGLSNISAQFEHIINQFSRPENSKQKLGIQNIVSESDLNNFERAIENPDVEEELKQQYSIICGKGKGRGINNAYALVDSMFSRSFLLLCSWAGGSRSKEQKICFKSHTKIINFFFDIVHESDRSFTLLDCHNFFKIILKNSRQRCESKQERMSSTKNRPKKNKSLPITVVETSDTENLSES